MTPRQKQALLGAAILIAILLALVLTGTRCASTRPPTTTAPAPSRKFSTSAAFATNSALGTPCNAIPGPPRMLEVEYTGGSVVSYARADGRYPVESLNMNVPPGSPPAPPVVARRYMTCLSSVWTLDSPQPNPTVAPSSQCPPEAQQFQYDSGWPGTSPGYLPTPNAEGDLVLSQVYRVRYSCGSTRETMTVDVPPGTYHLLLPWPDPFVADTIALATPTPTPTPTPRPVSIAITTGPAIEGSTIALEAQTPGLDPQEWIALYRATAADLDYSACAQCWKYLDGSQIQPTAARSSASLSFTAPGPGAYNFRMFAANGVSAKIFQTADFTVAAAPTPTSTPVPPTATPTIAPSSTPTLTPTAIPPTSTPTPGPAAVTVQGVPAASTYAFRIAAAGDFRVFVHLATGTGIVSWRIDAGVPDTLNVGATPPAPRWIRLIPFYGTGTGVFHFNPGVHYLGLGFVGVARVDAALVTTSEVGP